MAKEEEKKSWKDNICTRGKGGKATGGNAVYGLGFVGALIYFLTHATSLTMGLLGIIKAIFWPAFLVYKALEVFKF
jgi:hypothetical protein